MAEQILAGLEVINNEVEDFMRNTSLVGTAVDTFMSNDPFANKEIATNFWISNFVQDLKRTSITSLAEMFRATVVWEIVLLYSSPRTNVVSLETASRRYSYYRQIISTLEEKMICLLAE